MKNLDNFEWKSAGDTNLNFSFINAAEGAELLEKYNRIVKEDYQDNEWLMGVLAKDRNAIGGCNIYSAILLNQILREEGIRTATPRDIEILIQNKCLQNGKFLTDLGLILRGEYNDYLDSFKTLNNQIKDSGHNFNTSLVIPLTGLNLKDISGKHNKNLEVRLNSDAQIIPVAQLSYDGENIKYFNRTDENGMPQIGEKGERQVNTRPGNGIFRYCLSFLNFNIITTYSRLDSSEPEMGRVILIKNK